MEGVGTTASTMNPFEEVALRVNNDNSNGNLMMENVMATATTMTMRTRTITRTRGIGGDWHGWRRRGGKFGCWGR